MIGWIESLTGCLIVDPAMLALIGFIALGFVLRRVLSHPGIRFGPARLIQPSVGTNIVPLPRSFRQRLRWLPIALRVLGLACMVLALARPVERIRLPETSEGIDILLCLDVSSSMTEKDMDPRKTRLDVAKESATRFIGGRPEDRIGLITFARYPDVVCPLTRDHHALSALLDRVKVTDRESAEDATGIGTALARAAQMLGSNGIRSPVVILLTDGEENVATAATPHEIAPLHAAQLSRDLKIRINTIVAGIGRPSSTGAWLPLDTTQVAMVAEKTGGRFFEAKDADAIERVYREINQLEKTELSEPRFEIKEHYVAFILVGLLAFALAAVLERTWLEVMP